MENLTQPNGYEIRLAKGQKMVFGLKSYGKPVIKDMKLNVLN